MSEITTSQVQEDNVEPTINHDKNAEPTLTPNTPSENMALSAPDPDPKLSENPPSETAQSPDLTNNTEPAPWAPEYKYEAGGESHEMDEWVKNSIKDQETFDKVKTLYERSYGLESANQQLSDVSQKYEKLESGLQYLSQLSEQYRNNPTDFNNARTIAQEFITSLGLPKELFLQYAVEELKYQNLPQEERTQIDLARQQQDQSLQNQFRVSQLEQQIQTQQETQYRQMLDQKLNDPVVSQRVQAYEQSIGRPGAFRDMVVQRGVFHQQVNGRNLMPDQVVEEVLQLIPVINNPAQQTATQTVPQVTQQKPVLQNVSGTGSVSPVKSSFTSVDQLRDRYKELTSH